MRRRTPDRPLTRPLARVLVVVLATFALGGTGTAFAEDLPDPITPPGVTPPPDGGDNQVPPGPTYVITPGAGGSELGEPADQAEVDEAKKAGTKASGAGKAPAGTTKKSGSTVAGPGASPRLPGERPTTAVSTPLDPWWMVGSGALLLLVVLEFGMAATRRFRRQSE